MPRAARLAWLALLIVVVAVQLAGYAYVLFDAYRLAPARQAIGIAIDFDDDDRAIVGPLRRDVVASGVRLGDRIVAVGPRRFGPEASGVALSRAIMAAPGDVVPLTVAKPDGRELRVRVARSSRAPLVAAPNPLPLTLRMGLRLAFTLLCSLALAGSSLVLLRRRGHDPEAFLLGIGFLGIATTADPVLPMWMALGLGGAIDVLTGLWWTVLAIALAAFPDGRFTPRALRWSLVAAPVLGVVLMVDPLGEVSALLLGVCVPLLLLAGQVVRYRRLAPGVARQQIKWAGLGFSAGFVLVGIALAMSLAPYDEWGAALRGGWLLGTVCLFSLGFALMPLGLLMSMLRYRLWDVDRIISRSVAFTLLSGAIALLWALLSDVAKQVVSALLGPDHAILGLVLGAIVAVGVLMPTQRWVQRWSKRRFNPSSLDLERLPERLRLWRDRCDAPEVAARALDVALRALHAPAGAVFARTPTGEALLARRSAVTDGAPVAPPASSAGADGRHVLHLEDEDGLAGWMVLAPRGDGSRFPRAELDSLSATAAPLAKALRIAASVRQEAAVLSALDQVQERLARLERTGARPA